jgi:hypothetical protein
LAHDARLLRRRRRIDAAQERTQLLLRALRSGRESEDADDQRDERDRREEKLERDGAGEEYALVIPEGRCDGARVADECPERPQDAASLLGVGLSGAFVSDFFSAFESAALLSLFVSVLVSDFASLFLSLVELVASDPFSAGRLSVLYQPEPLKTIAGVEIKRRGFLPQLGHFSSASSLYDWTAENTWPQ